MTKTKNRVPELLVTYSYIRSRLGYASKIGESMWKSVADALAKDGIFNTENSAPKTFVANNADYIIKEGTIAQQTEKPRKINKAKGKSKTETKVVVEQAKPALSLTEYEAYQRESRRFLASGEWKRKRMEAFKLWGRKCQCCGATPDDGVTVLNVDHIKPRLTHPWLSLEINNLQILCSNCNHGKGNWDDTDWRPQGKQKSVTASTST